MNYFKKQLFKNQTEQLRFYVKLGGPLLLSRFTSPSGSSSTGGANPGPKSLDPACFPTIPAITAPDRLNTPDLGN